MTCPIPYPAKSATKPTPTTAEGHLAILRRLFLRAGVKGGKLSEQEVMMGAESVEALRGMLEDKHTDQLRQVGHD